MSDRLDSQSKAKKCFYLVEQFFCYWLLGAIVIFMMLFITSEVIGRLAFSHSFIGIVDIVSVCMIAVAFLSLSGVQRYRQHITMDFVTLRYQGKQSGVLLEIVTQLILLASLIAVFYAGTYNVLDTWRSGSVTMTIYWPTWPFTIAIPVGAALMFCRCIIQLWDEIKTSSSVRKGP